MAVRMTTRIAVARVAASALWILAACAERSSREPWTPPYPPVAVAQVLEASKRRPVVVWFWARWDIPDRHIEPELATLAAEHRGRLDVYTAHVDDPLLLDFCTRYSQPGTVSALALFRDGAHLKTHVGLHAVTELRRTLTGGLPR